MVKPIILSKADKANFRGLVIKFGPNDCWLWEGAHDKDGYGVFHPRFGAASWYRAHRVACFLAYGDAGRMTCHTCGNTGCVNPKHLYPGNGKRNSADRDKQPHGIHGEKHWKSKLTNEQTLTIARLYMDGKPLYEIAKIVGVNRRLVTRVCNGEVGKWLTGFKRQPVRKQPHYKNWKK